MSGIIVNDHSVFIFALVIIFKIEIMSIGCDVKGLSTRWPRCSSRLKLVSLTEGPPYDCWHPGFVQTPAVNCFPIMHVDDVVLPLERLANLS